MSDPIIALTLDHPTEDVVPDDAATDVSVGRSTRRALLLASVGATGAMVAQALGQPLAASATSVRLGALNSTTKPTEFDNTRHSSSAKAVVGLVTYTGTGGATAGVQGISRATQGNGVMGVANHGGSAYGVYGRSSSGTGVVGDGTTGVTGFGDPAVYGYSAAGTGVQGASGASTSYGALATTVDGVFAYTNGATGVYSFNEGGHLGWAGYFDGDVWVDTLYAATSFTSVDHPAAPGERWYRTALVGSFEHIDVISGNARTGSDGRVSVRVADEFARYHSDFRYQLTPVGAAVVPFVAKRMAGGRFVIGTDRPRTAVSWQVTGRRTDPAAREAAFKVDVRKDAGERGRFLQPRLYGKSVRRGIKRPLAARHPTVTRRAPKDIGIE